MKTEGLATMPQILEANTFFWKPSINADGRRRNEIKRNEEVKNWLLSKGFDIDEDRADGVRGVKKDLDLEVIFNYSESCKNVYKNLAINKAGKKSNITALRKL